MTRGFGQVSLISSNVSPAAGGEIAGSDVWDCVARKIWGSEMNVLFTLYAWDHAEGGLHHGLSHTACAIIAGNQNPEMVRRYLRKMTISYALVITIFTYLTPVRSPLRALCVSCVS
jgi:hypothetical protein